MATRKQKHAAALAKRERFMARVEDDGLAALKAYKEREAKRDAEIKEEIDAIDKRHRNILAQQVVASLKKDHAEVTVGEFLEAANRFLPTFSG